MNMSYCRFQNTAKDLDDCVAHIYDIYPKDMDENTLAERNARGYIILLAAQLMEELGISDVTDTHAIMEIIKELDVTEF